MDNHNSIDCRIDELQLLRGPQWFSLSSSDGLALDSVYCVSCNCDLDQAAVFQVFAIIESNRIILSGDLGPFGGGRGLFLLSSFYLPSPGEGSGLFTNGLVG